MFICSAMFEPKITLCRANLSLPIAVHAGPASGWEEIELGTTVLRFVD
jgi:hypothetical protein